MRLLLVSDTESKYIWDYFDPAAFSGVKAVISCGDLKRQYLEFLACMIPAPLFYVPGNHDKRFSYDPPCGCIPLDGRLEEYMGLKICGLGGCKSGAPGRKYEYSENEMDRMTSRLSRQIKKRGGADIFVTHAPALGMGDGDDIFHQGFQSFYRILDSYKPRLYVFGHQHRNYKHDLVTPEFYGPTHVVNAYGYKIIDI